MERSLISLVASAGKLSIDKACLARIITAGETVAVNAVPRWIFNMDKVCRSAEMQEIEVTASIERIDGNDAIFYHPIFGVILAQDYGWRGLFSSQRFVADLKAADDNPKIIAHFVHICSGGGEAWFLDRVAEAMQACRKPIYVFTEMYCCSAAYYIAANGSCITAYTPNDTIGCVGTMCVMVNYDKMLEDWGVKEIELYAHQSDLKNRKYNDARNGNPEQFITEELDPLAAQFIESIRAARPALGKLADDDPILRGETFYANLALEQGMIDGIVTIDEAVRECYELGITIRHNNNLI